MRAYTLTSLVLLQIVPIGAGKKSNECFVAQTLYMYKKIWYYCWCSKIFLHIHDLFPYLTVSLDALLNKVKCSPQVLCYFVLYWYDRFFSQKVELTFWNARVTVAKSILTFREIMIAGCCNTFSVMQFIIIGFWLLYENTQQLYDILYRIAIHVTYRLSVLYCRLYRWRPLTFFLSWNAIYFISFPMNGSNHRLDTQHFSLSGFSMISWLKRMHESHHSHMYQIKLCRHPVVASASQYAGVLK